ncbi:hypothetical protein PUNSTDRAFT_144335 [Punctularia strigosozonata HHB-11173 SS5]|uniref:uncharacterized protein n=1 Tax=Punctularia strigosozonata (strain HHB-11173) TaxID=741275 RepID=UPI0004417E2B|nr:uncharacterized protein PUNSTDRAFT_144335 [Punctularia strigosozonata HHB-11173 SS5]EIN07815.1 hypothetical protein PUNSTDRAFT_144335 [Punctularia strigosozonata HHB-11173 SS5]
MTSPTSNGSGPSNFPGIPADATSASGAPYAPSSSSALSLNGANGYNQNPQARMNEEIVNHLYHAGFQNGLWADTVLHAHHTAYRLHAIILSRSPYLAHLMSTSPQNGGQRTIYLNLEHEPEVTVEGLAIALGYLYSPISFNLVRAENARGVLAAGCLLGGVEELCTYAYEACRQSITVETIDSWLAFSDLGPTPSSALSSPSTPTMDLTPHPQLPPTIFGLYAHRLRDDVFNFLVVQLPQILGVNPGTGASPNADGRATLLQIYARVPFDLFKAAVESPTFQIGSDQARFKFAKEAIEFRKKGVARGSGAEETVVLAFGGGHDGGSAVHVTRKLRKRPLWKVNA